MTKKFSRLFLITLTLFTLLPNITLASNTEIDFIFSPTCPHCANEKVFLKDLQEENPDLIVNSYNIEDLETIQKLKQIYEKYNTPVMDQGLVPVTVVGEQIFIGFNDSIAQKISSLVAIQPEVEPNKSTDTELLGETQVPFLGRVRLAGLSPFGLAVILGTLDGFNACAMIALGFLLTILITTGVRKNLILIGGTFILVSGFIYFLFMTAWLNLLIVTENFKYLSWLTALIIIAFAIFTLKDYFYGVICKLCQIPTDKDKITVKWERKLFQKLESIVSNKLSLPVLLAGVALVAIGINSVELVCSFGFPLAFTKFLIGSEITGLSYYGYILVYVLFYMLDDFLIFLVAVFTLRTTKFSDKYLKIIKLVSGVVLLLLGIIMLLKPELLSFT